MKLLEETKSKLTFEAFARESILLEDSIRNIASRAAVLAYKLSSIEAIWGEDAKAFNAQLSLHINNLANTKQTLLDNNNNSLSTGDVVKLIEYYPPTISQKYLTTESFNAELLQRISQLRLIVIEEVPITSLEKAKPGAFQIISSLVFGKKEETANNCYKVAVMPNNETPVDSALEDAIKDVYFNSNELIDITYEDSYYRERLSNLQDAITTFIFGLVDYFGNIYPNISGTDRELFLLYWKDELEFLHASFGADNKTLIGTLAKLCLHKEKFTDCYFALKATTDIQVKKRKI